LAFNLSTDGRAGIGTQQIFIVSGTTSTFRDRTKETGNMK